MPTLPTFEEHTGVTADINETSSPYDCFSIFFPLSIVHHVKKETNRYAAAIVTKLRRSNKLKPNSLLNKWQPVKLHEVYLFFSVIIHMCLVKKPKLSDYWSKNSILCTPFPSSLMSRDRFKSILSNLHLNDNNNYIPRNQPNHDPLFKLRPFLDHLLQAFPASFAPHGKLTVDEGMCGFRGRIHFKVYMKGKPEKYGIKLFVVCDACTGYVLRMEVYAGKGAQDSGVMSVLDRLLSDYYDKGFTVFMDRYYSSPVIFDHLWEKKTTAVGTCMPNRKQLPQNNVVQKKIKKNEMVFMRRNHLLCLKWKDTRDVLMLSTCHKATSTDVTVRTRDGPKQKSKPDVILDYNVSKTGVDKADQMIAYYPFKRKQLKWWKKLFFHLFVMAITNAFVLYKETRSLTEKSKVRLEQFMVDLGEAFAKEGRVTLDSNSTSSSSNNSSSNRLIGRHFVEKIPPTEKKQNPTRTCKVCADIGKAQTGKCARKETCWYCAVCDVALCVPACFKKYHTQANYEN